MANKITIFKRGLTYIDKAVILSWNRYYQRTSMSEEIKAPALAAALINEFPLRYSKAHFHRVIHADGIYGGSTPTPGNLIVHVYSHMLPLPDFAVNDANGNEIVDKRIVKPGIDREIEVSLVMNLTLAKSMRDWLDNRIQYTENLMKSSGVK